MMRPCRYRESTDRGSNCRSPFLVGGPVTTEQCANCGFADRVPAPELLARLDQARKGIHPNLARRLQTCRHRGRALRQRGGKPLTVSCDLG